MTKKGWLFTILSVLFGGMVISPGPGGTALRGQLQRAGQNLMQRVDRSMRRRINHFMRQLKFIGWLLFLWPFAMIGASLLPTAWAHYITPAVSLAPFLFLLWTFTRGFALATLLAGITGLSFAHTVGKFKPAIKVFVDDFENSAQKALKTLRIFIGIECIAGLLLGWTPIANDRELIIPLLLLVGIAACFAGINRAIVRVAVTVIVVIFGIWFLGGRPKAKATASSAWAGVKSGIAVQNVAQVFEESAFHPDQKCTTGTDHQQVELHYETSVEKHLDVDFPKGCAVLLVLPNAWPIPAIRFRQIDTNPKSEFYFQAPDGPWHWPIGWTRHDVEIPKSRVFWIQGTKDGEKLRFGIDDLQ